MEYWKDIKGYEGLYQVSNLGRIKSLAKEWVSGRGVVRRKNDSILKDSPEGIGYRKVGLSNGNYRKLHRVHRLVAAAFIDNPENKPEVNHINGIKDDNRVDNLEWCTREENANHAIQTGLKEVLRGENSPMFGLTGAKSFRSKKVVNTDTGEVFQCAKHAAERLGISKSYFNQMLNGVYNNSTPMRYV